jgi:putative FmdB family regulatory protein
MPIFEYMCDSCGAVFEELESVTNRDKPHECPVCGKKKGRRIVSTFATSSGSRAASCGSGGFT